MSSLRRSRRAYAVDGVEPSRGSNGNDSFTGADLAGQPAVIEAVARLPQVPALTGLMEFLSVATGDGREWTLGFDAAIRSVFDLSYPGSDAFEDQLAAASWTESVERVEREVLAFTTTEVLAADMVLARCIDVCGEASRKLAGPSPD
jgi:hypothetical protein